jgi:hypothetical protein
MQAAGHDNKQSERLVELLKDTLTMWDRHRILIQERVAYLEKECQPGCPGN